jgi:B-box zinc finger
MNCANHPEVATAAYCQSCGKPLCTECIRSVGGVVYCEPCLAARLSTPGAAGAPTPDASLTNLHAHPVLAGLLGFIPGVGAMYNGQFVKALAHVLIFAVFVSLSDKSFIFGMLVAAWTFYQVFDAAQTAKARRDGLPLPNPFGLNDLGTRLGVTPAPPAAPFAAGFAANPAPGTPAGPAAAADPNSGFNPGANPAGTGPFLPIRPPMPRRRRRAVIRVPVPRCTPTRLRPSPTGTRWALSCSSASACCYCCTPSASLRRSGSAGRGRSSSSASAPGYSTAEATMCPGEAPDEHLAADPAFAWTGLPHPVRHYRVAQPVGHT